MDDLMRQRESQPERRDRRHKDAFLQVLTLLGVVTAVITLISLLLLNMAQPTSWSRLNRFNLTTWWNPIYLRYFFYLMILGLLSSSLGIALNLRRLKRKYDSVRVNLIFMWIFSFIGIAVYLGTQ